VINASFQIVGTWPWCSEAWKIKVRAGVNSWCNSFRKRPDMLSGPVALCGCKADKRLFIPLGCICICSRSGIGDGPIVGTLVVSSSLYIVNDRNTSISADEKNP
jgi:hypothetical protein